MVRGSVPLMAIIWQWNVSTFVFMMIGMTIDIFILGKEGVLSIMNMITAIGLVGISMSINMTIAFGLAGISIAILNFGVSSPILYTVAATSTLVGYVTYKISSMNSDFDLSLFLNMLGAIVLLPMLAANEARKGGAKERFFNLYLTALPCIGIIAGIVLSGKPKK